jgi:hypothetical protein
MGHSSWKALVSLVLFQKCGFYVVPTQMVAVCNLPG